jgi:hypothetical protein
VGSSSAGRRIAVMLAASVLVLPMNAPVSASVSDEQVQAEPMAQLLDAWEQDPATAEATQRCRTPPLDPEWDCRRFGNAAGAFIVVFNKEDTSREARTRIDYGSGEVRSDNRTQRDSTNHAVGIDGREVLSTPCFRDISPCFNEVPSASSGQVVELAAALGAHIIHGNHEFTVP